MPSRYTSTFSHSESAFTQVTPTPWRPPDTLYAFDSNFPPAWSFVITTSRVSMPSTVGWGPTGMPEPLSTTVTELSVWMVTLISSARPAMASSTELSTTSKTRWWRPRSPTSPMYMFGRLRTASSPSSTLMVSVV